MNCSGSHASTRIDGAVSSDSKALDEALRAVLAAGEASHAGSTRGGWPNGLRRFARVVVERLEQGQVPIAEARFVGCRGWACFDPPTGYIRAV